MAPLQDSSEALGIKTKGPSIPLPLCDCYGGSQQFAFESTRWGFISGFKVRGREGEGEEISHLFFVDDTIVLFGASQEQVTNLCWLLMWFEAISGLKINLEKSEMILVGEVDNLKELDCEIGCKVGKLSTSYLRLLLGASYKSMVVWYKVEERFHKRLSLWKMQQLSKERRLTSLHSTLANLRIYFMSLFTIPRVVKLRLEKIQRDFLWGRETLENKIHFVKFSIVCTVKAKGGLGVRSLSLLNRVLLVLLL